MEIKTLYASYSEAMRVGIQMYPTEVHGTWVTDCGTCAIGSGMLATLGPTGLFNSERIMDVYPYLRTAEAVCPACEYEYTLFGIVQHLFEDEYTLFGIVQHLFEDHNWTRLACADWLETIEESLGYVTVSDEGFGSTQRVVAYASPLSEAVETHSQARV